MTFSRWRRRRRLIAEARELERQAKESESRAELAEQDWELGSPLAPVKALIDRDYPMLRARTAAQYRSEAKVLRDRAADLRKEAAP